MTKAYTEARDQHGESELLDEIVAAKPKVDHTLYHSPEGFRDQGLAQLRDAVALLRARRPLRNATITGASPSLSPTRSPPPERDVHLQPPPTRLNLAELRYSAADAAAWPMIRPGPDKQARHAASPVPVIGTNPAAAAPGGGPTGPRSEAWAQAAAERAGRACGFRAGCRCAAGPGRSETRNPISASRH